MPLVPLNANFALKILLPLTKIDKFHATNAPPAVPPKRAAPNVPIAHRANLKMLSTKKKFVPNAPLDLHKVKQTKAIVPNAPQEPKHPKTAAVFARLATWANTTRWTVAYVCLALPDNTKTAKGKQHVWSATWTRIQVKKGKHPNQIAKHAIQNDPLESRKATPIPLRAFVNEKSTTIIRVNVSIAQPGLIAHYVMALLLLN